MPVLRRTLNDRSPFVRRYVAIAIGKFGIEDDIGRLSAQCRRDRNPISRVGYWEALYILGKQGSLPKLLAFLKHKDYRIRCASAHALESTSCSGSDSAVAIQVLKERSRYETTVAAQSSIQSSLRALKEKRRRLGS